MKHIKIVMDASGIDRSLTPVAFEIVERNRRLGEEPHGGFIIISVRGYDAWPFY